ncbi:MAG: CDP-diacylglycerol--serine O-phosphatidyltransferase [Deltaproteobacteria bacterium]|nr:CDP-diacylglycerol--serine O-phosphatidyltransferase [Deltaproteobacteria bacterium]
MQAVDEVDAKRRRRRRRRRRRDAPDRGGFAALLPQLLTTGNLAAGFLAIIKASNGEVLHASYAIFVAALFDILDGRAARMTGNESRFGAEYDSISDTVSFGVAPAVLAFHAGDFADLRWAGGVMAFVYTACASLRLARFNVQSGRYLYRFDGMPTPAGAGMVLSAVWFRDFLVGPNQELGLHPIVPALGVVFLGLLMVSPIPYRSFKDLKLGHGFSGTVIPVIVLIVLWIEPGLNFFLVGLAYVASGPAGMLWRWKTGQELLPAQSPEDLAAAEAVGPAPAKGRGGDPGGRSIWEELDPSSPRDDEGPDAATPRDATNVTSLADHLSSGGTRGEGGR